MMRMGETEGHIPGPPITAESINQRQIPWLFFLVFYLAACGVGRAQRCQHAPCRGEDAGALLSSNPFACVRVCWVGL